MNEFQASSSSSPSHSNVSAGKAVVHIDQIFDILYREHTSNNHLKIGKLHTLISAKYYNITRECVKVFSSLCEVCKNTKKPEERETPKPVKKLNLKKPNGRVWVAFLDQDPVEELSVILLYKDCSTKFTHIRAIKNTEPLTIALTLVEIMTAFGSPYIIHVDIEADLRGNVLICLAKIFPTAKIIQGDEDMFKEDIERTKAKVEEKIEKLFEVLSWPIAIKLIQSELNQTKIDDNVSPYELLFGVPMNHNGDIVRTIPADLLNEIYDESEEPEP